MVKIKDWFGFGSNSSDDGPSTPSVPKESTTPLPSSDNNLPKLDDAERNRRPLVFDDTDNPESCPDPPLMRIGTSKDHKLGACSLLMLSCVTGSTSELMQITKI